MLEEDLFITITGLTHYYAMAPVEAGRWVSLVKEPENAYDQDAILVRMPLIGKIGYVANSVHTVARGSLSAGRIYDRLPEECAAIIRFIAGNKVIAQVFPAKKLIARYEPTLEDQDIVTVKAWRFSKT